MTKPMGRRSFLGGLAGLLAAAGKALAAGLQRFFPNPNEDRAVAEGKRLGVGSVKLSGPQSAQVLSHQTWTLVYTAGPAGIAPGGGIRVALRHLQRQAAVPQATAPAEANYVSAVADGEAAVRVDIPNGWKTFMTQYFPWQNVIQVTLPERGLDAGQRLRIILGDRSGGGPGMRVQPYDESHYGLKCYADVDGKGRYLPLGTMPTIEVVGAEPYRLQAVMPSDAVAGEPTWCIVRAEDGYGNPAPRFRGRVALESTDPEATLPSSHRFNEADRGICRFEGLRFAAPGTQRIKAVGLEDERERFHAAANPVRVAAQPPSELLLWGDLHGHTLLSDGRGTVDEYYDFAERVAGLDFCAVSDHAFEMVDEMWEHCKAVTNARNRPGRFVTIHGYEWSGRTSDGGDHNVYFLEDDPPIYRSTLMYDSRNLQMDHVSEKVETVAELMARLAARLKYKDVFCIPHFGGRRGNPRWHDPRVQRLIEIYSDHRRSEPWAASFLAAGHRLGIMASSDNHYGNPGYGYLKILHDWDKQEIGTGLVAVYAGRRTRESIFHALYDRRTYATSGARILLDFRLDGQPMGSEVKVQRPPTLVVDATGTAPIDRVEIKKNGETVHTATPKQELVRMEWQDGAFQPGPAGYYYVRITQADGEEAISSPVWVHG